VLCALGGAGVARFFAAFEKSRFLALRSLFMALFVAAFLLTSLLPAITTALPAEEGVPTLAERQAYAWLQANTAPEAVLLAAPRDGFALAYLAQRATVIDEDYLLAPDVTARALDIEDAYSAVFQVDAFQTFDKYGVTHVLLTPQTRVLFNVTSLRYADQDCLPLVYDTEVKIYQVRCDLTRT
jgi:hypothetical protein